MRAAIPGIKNTTYNTMIERGLHARPHRAVKEVATDMGILCQRIGPAEHERRAVQHIIEVEDPCRRHVHDVALEDFEADDGHQHDNQPSRSLADPRADFVNDQKKFLDRHWSPPVIPKKD